MNSGLFCRAKVQRSRVTIPSVAAMLAILCLPLHFRAD